MLKFLLLRRVAVRRVTICNNDRHFLSSEPGGVDFITDPPRGPAASSTDFLMLANLHQALRFCLKYNSLSILTASHRGLALGFLKRGLLRRMPNRLSSTVSYRVCVIEIDKSYRSVSIACSMPGLYQGCFEIVDGERLDPSVLEISLNMRTVCTGPLTVEESHLFRGATTISKICTMQGFLSSASSPSSAASS